MAPGGSMVLAEGLYDIGVLVRFSVLQILLRGVESRGVRAVLLQQPTLEYWNLLV